MEIDSALLENWMRRYYFETDIDIGSSGVESFSLADIRRVVGLSLEDIERVIFYDSWTLGDPSLRQAIAARWAKGNAQMVMVTQGSSEAIYLVMNALLRRGDEVVVLEPCYQQLYAIAGSIGCSLKRWHLRFERKFFPSVEEVKSLINSQTRMVIVNFPHNPTGASLSIEEQGYLIEVVAKTGAYLVWDAAFSELVYDCQPLPEPALLYERAISLATLSKAYGLPGLRVGWCLAPPDVLERMIHLRDYTTLYLSPLVELIARRVIERADSILAIRLKQARNNLATVSDWVEQYFPMIEWVLPQGGVCAFPRLNCIRDVEAFCHHLAQSERVLLVPGTCFNRPGHVRLGFGGSAADLQKGLSRLSILLQRFSDE
jgi:capreomycidine synthase